MCSCAPSSPYPKKHGHKSRTKCRAPPVARTTTRARCLALAHTQAYPRMPKWCVWRPPCHKLRPFPPWLTRRVDGNSRTTKEACRKVHAAVAHGPQGPSKARFFVAAFFCTSRLVVWKVATASVPPKGCKNKCGHYIPAYTLVWGGPSSRSRWCEWQRVKGAGAGVFERADRSPGPHQRGCRAPFPGRNGLRTLRQ